LIREIFVEAAVLSVSAGGLALVVVAAAGTLVAKLLLPPVLTEYASLDVHLIATTAAVCAGSALILGLIPALRLTSRRFLDPARSVQARSSSRVLDAFAGAQVALSLPLIVGASLFSLSLWHARQVDFGLDSTHVAVVSMNEEEVGSTRENHAAHRRIQERLKGLPQVRSTALVQGIPMATALALAMEVPGHPWGEGWHTPPYVDSVDPSFFDVMAMRFVAGRPFTSAENVAGGRPVLVVNEAMARLFWPGKSALGQCVIVYSGDSRPDDTCSDVVGVVANAAMWPALESNGDSEPRYYIPIEQYSMLRGRAVLVNTTSSPDGVLSLLRREAQATGASLPFIDVWAFDDVFQPALKPLRLGAVVFIAFGLLGLVIAAIGLAAVTAYGVARRTREFGIRLVLGAEPAMLVRQTLARSLVAVVLGLAAGTLLAYMSSRWMQSVLFGVASADVRVYVAAGALLAAVGAVAAYVSARRAGHVEPAAALRAE
jgi:predicted permease